MKHLFAVVSLGAFGSTACFATWEVFNLHPLGATDSECMAIDAGVMVGGINFTHGPTRAVRWDNFGNSYMELHPPEATRSWANDVQAGKVAGSVLFNGLLRAGLWEGPSASWTNLSGLDGGECLGIDGSTQVGAIGSNPYLWSGSSQSGVQLSIEIGQATAADAGVQVGWIQLGDYRRACLWNGTASSHMNLHPNGYLHSMALGIHGSTQVGTANGSSGVHAGLWTGSAASWVDLHPTGALDSYAFGVFEDWQVGYSNFMHGNGTASLWSGSASSWEDLEQALTGSWGHTQANDAWADDIYLYVVGYGFNNATGRNEALLWKRPKNPPRTISGRLRLRNRDAVAPPVSSVQIEFRDVGSTVPILTRTATLNSVLDFSVVGPVLPGQYDVSIKHRHWLRKTLTINTVPGDITGLQVTCTNGDVDWDNEVGPGDFGRLSTAFGTQTGDSNFDPEADLDEDGEVGPADFGILSGAFGLVGDE